VGVIYKLKPEIVKYILEEKEANPNLSSRSLAVLVGTKFNVKFSKSSINVLIKNAGLSMPVGRRIKKKRHKMQLPALPEPLADVKPVIVPPVKPPVEAAPSRPVIEAHPVKPAEEKLFTLLEAKPIEENKLPETAIETVTKDVNLRHSEVPDSLRPAQAPAPKNLEVNEILRPAVGLPQDDKNSVSQQPPINLPPPPEPVVEIKPAAEAKPKEEPVKPKKEETIEKTVEMRLLETQPKAGPQKAEPPKIEPPKAEPIKAEPLKVEPVSAPIPKPPVYLPVEEWAGTQTTGAIILKAADYLIGGSATLANAIKEHLSQQQGENILANTESLIYKSLFAPDKYTQEKTLPELWALLGKKVSVESTEAYLNDLQGVRVIGLDIQRLIANTLQEVLCVKINLSNGSTLYLDAQMYTIWSTLQISYDFSSTIYNIKNYINNYFYQNKPFILFMAPGYDTPTKEFFNFILSFDPKEKRINKITLYGNKFEELEVIPLEQAKKRYFVFGFWPWQFVNCRKVKRIEAFKPCYFEALKKELYVADIEIELLQPKEGKSVTLRGCALKNNPSEKVRLIVLSNFDAGTSTPEELAGAYLSRWPNLEEAFRDYSRKIELSTYTGTAQSSFTAAAHNLEKGPSSKEINSHFEYYLKVLDLYARWHFLPTGYEDKDFWTTKEQFYNLKVNLSKGKNDCLQAAFQAPAGYGFTKELEYTCRRLNEREIYFSPGARLWFSL